MDLFGVSMIMPLILPQARDLGASPTLAGVLGSVYGGLQLVSSPVVGNWSDTVGRQLSLVVCLFLSGCGYAVLGLYSSIPIFFAGRFVLGCFKHSQTISKAYFADVISGQDQAAALGNFNSFSSVGFIAGPIIGGHLAEVSFSLAAFAAGIVFVTNAILIWWAVPSDYQSNHQTQRKTDNGLVRQDTSTSLKKLESDEINFSFSKLIKSFKDFDWVELWDLFLVKFFAGFSVIIYRTNFSQMLKEKFEASPKTIGYMNSYTGAVATLSGFLIGKITKRYSSTSQLLLHVTVLQVITLLCLTIAPSIPMLIICLTPLSFVTSISRVSGTTLTVQRSGNSAVGSIMGLSQSVMAVARMMAPFLAGVAQEFSVDGAGYISVLAAAASVLIMVLRPQDPEVRQKKLA